MFKKILFSIISLTLFAGCAKDSPQINAVCELKPNGTYLIKWETFPPMEGVVKAYESTNPDSFNRCSPIFEQDIQAGYQNVLAKAFTRSYLKLVFNKKYATVIAPRNIPMQGIFNFRDLGGYYTNDHQQMKWGKIYRSGSLSMATHYDRDLLKGLKITSVVDLRTERERDNYPNKYQATQVYNLPLRGNRHDFFFDEILSNRMNASDILVYDQNIFSFLMENNADYFIKLFDILLNEKNYPVV
ncbi:MAG: tyrosine-protein phosphatase, partial [Candidatus Symbiothrix sp.]|nr:tyrosine-protein phosphatase [Candidatus Symbiothrix sp.]